MQMGVWARDYDVLCCSDGALRLALELCNAAGNAYTGWPASGGAGPASCAAASARFRVGGAFFRSCQRLACWDPGRRTSSSTRISGMALAWSKENNAAGGLLLFLGFAFPLFRGDIIKFCTTMNTY